MTEQQALESALTTEEELERQSLRRLFPSDPNPGLRS